jgi:hypothetical protein
MRSGSGTQPLVVKPTIPHTISRPPLQSWTDAQVPASKVSSCKSPGAARTPEAGKTPNSGHLQPQDLLRPTRAVFVPIAGPEARFALVSDRPPPLNCGPDAGVLIGALCLWRCSLRVRRQLTCGSISEGSIRSRYFTAVLISESNNESERK